MSDPLLRLYPAAYRAAYGREILDVHREMTIDLPRWARLRADADLVAHAVRVRLRLDSAAAGGRFFALAAPFALAVAAAYGGIQLMRWYAGLAISPGSTWSHLVTMDLAWSLNVGFLGLMSAGAIIALLRWWVPGVVLAVAGLLGFAVQWTFAPSLYGDGPFEAIAAALTALVILACPPDRRSDRRLSAVAGAAAAVAWFPIALVLTRNFIVSTDYGVWPLLVLALTGAALALHARSSGLRELGAMVVAAPLFLAYAATSGWLAILR
ncbi:hypothetical protein [Kribbella sp. CA-293567]|uniref:hypothetical protein n=1 Tax=Kribbella sp. CA-293567 TaxID=3002436 RepID=UPI0022DE245D|nr:hypothetical protein [Kribbella sp. CA-293567]WBQ02634.1 hypothetical protein OX958_21910 [Kribbella sp. CA-293567]